MLERLYRMRGEKQNAAVAAERLSTIKELPPQVVQAGSLFSDGDLSASEDILRVYLLNAGKNPEALRLLGRIQHQRGVLEEAELLLEASERSSRHRESWKAARTKAPGVIAPHER